VDILLAKISEIPDFLEDTAGEFGKPNPPALHLRSGFPPLPTPPLQGEGKGKAFLAGRGSRKAPPLSRRGVGEGSDPSVNSPTVSLEKSGIFKTTIHPQLALRLQAVHLRP